MPMLLFTECLFFRPNCVPFFAVSRALKPWFVGGLGCLAPLDPKALRREDFRHGRRGELEAKGCARLIHATALPAP